MMSTLLADDTNSNGDRPLLLAHSFPMLPFATPVLPPVIPPPPLRPLPGKAVELVAPIPGGGWLLDRRGDASIPPGMEAVRPPLPPGFPPCLCRNVGEIAHGSIGSYRLGTFARSRHFSMWVVPAHEDGVTLPSPRKSKNIWGIIRDEFNEKEGLAWRFVQHEK